MAHQALGGAVESVASRSVTVSCTAKLTNLDRGDNGPPGHVPGDADWDGKATIALIEVPGLQTRIEGHWGTASGPLYEREVYLVADWLGGSGYVLLEDEADSSPVPVDSDLYSLTCTISGLRRGDSLENIGAAETPNLWKNRRRKRLWYADGYTTLTITCAGHTATLYLVGGLTGGPPSWDTVQDDTLTPRLWGTLGPITCQATTWNASYVMVEYRSVTSDGALMDTADINDTFAGCIAAGSGGFDVKSATGSGSGMAAPWRFWYFGRISKFGEDADDWARVLDTFYVPEQTYPPDSSLKTPQQDYLTFPADTSAGTVEVQITSHERKNKNFNGTFYFDLDPAWMGAEDPPLPSADAKIPIFGQPPLLPADETSTYQPVRITPLETVEVHRPDGNTPSSWASSDVGLITVAEGASSVFTVASTGAHVTRTFLSGWRAALGDNENYRTVKHTAGDDVWWWAQFAYLRLTINAPADGTLTLVVNWVDLEVSDNHETSRDVTYTEHPYSATYAVPVVSGANTVVVDLLFPASSTAGVPCYPTRVDSLVLSGFAVGEYTLSGIKLLAVEAPYLKHAIGVPRVRAVAGDPMGDASAIQITGDGAMGLQAVPDTLAKPDEVNDYAPAMTGGNIRYWDPLTGTVSEDVQDFQRTLQDFTDALNQVEGLEAVFDTDAEDEALKDAYSETLGPSPAEWLLPVVPFERMTLGGALDLDAALVLREEVICNGDEFLIWIDWPLWGARDVLVTEDGGRAPAGVDLQAYRNDTSATVATGSTDASGYAVLTPVPFNEDLEIGVRFAP